MNSSRQLLLGTGVFLGGGILLFSMMQQVDKPSTDELTDKAEVSVQANMDGAEKTVLTADVETEERILSAKKEERESQLAALDRRAQQYLSEQEKAEALAMEKARIENEKYRNNAIEPVMDEPVDNSAALVKPTVTKRTVEEEQKQKPVAATDQARPEREATTDAKTNTQAQSANKAPTNSQNYTVQHGDGLIKIAREYNIPVAALAQANKLSSRATLRVGQKLTIPSRNQITGLVNAYNSNSNTNNSRPNNQASSQTATSASASSAPRSQISYEVQRGDGLIKLARQYNVPVSALAQANNMSTNATLRVGQKVTIPSRLQIARLEREAEQRNRAAQNERDAQRRLNEARQNAARGEARGTFGVQVALADNQAKADEIVRQMRAAGYSATTSATSRGVRVIVGPEKGKEAALALKDKINADSRTGVNNAWVLYWR